LFDLNGRLVGIHSSIGNRLDINNHVPISVFLKDWEALLAGRQWGQLGIHPMADPESPILGFSMMEVLGVDGIVVEDVIENSPADQAGIRVGDVVTFMDNRSLNNVRDMLRELGRHRPGETVNLVVVRKGVSYRAELTFGRRGDLISGSKHRSR
jgi:serine protease Do